MHSHTKHMLLRSNTALILGEVALCLRMSHRQGVQDAFPVLYLMICLRQVRRDEGMDACPVKFLQRAEEYSHEAILACFGPGFLIIFIFIIFFLSSRPESRPSFNMN